MHGCCMSDPEETVLIGNERLNFSSWLDGKPRGYFVRPFLSGTSTRVRNGLTLECLSSCQIPTRCLCWGASTTLYHIGSNGHSRNHEGNWHLHISLMVRDTKRE